MIAAGELCDENEKEEGDEFMGEFGGEVNDEAADVKYKVLDNGNVRASILLDGDEDIGDSDFNNYKDFSLKCSSEGCKITDMFDSYGDSALQAVELACR